MKKKSDYVPAPTTIEEEMRARYQAVLQVVGGALSVTDAAKQVGLSRPRFQTLMHRGLTALVNELVPKVPGPAPVSEKERALKEENERLRRQVQKLEAQVETVDRMLGIASEMVRGRVKLTGRGPARERRAKTTTTPTTDEEKEEPEVAAVAKVAELRRLGMKAVCAAALAGRSASTLRRWSRRAKLGERVCRRPGPAARALLSGETTARIGELVRATHGLIGADSLRHKVPGTTRRSCSAVKKVTVRAMECERRAACERVEVTRPGVVRGFDQLYVTTTAGTRLVLFSADGAVPYRTSALLVQRYDGDRVLAAVEKDFDENGPPLVWRADRAKQHEDPRVAALLARTGTLLLHGPPRHPQYYAQLERQNREHRAWLDVLGVVDPEELAAALPRMLTALNDAWPRRSLDWKTAAEVWSSRQPVDVDRDALRDEVKERAARLRSESNIRDDRAERFAIEAALTQRQLIRRSAGGWC